MGFFPFVTRFGTTQPAVEHDITLDLTAQYPRQPPAIRPSCKPANFPIEIVMNVLEAAYYDDNTEPDDELLRNCALVCKDWSVPAQKLLFRNVVLRTEPAFDAFQDAVDRSTPRGRMFGDSVVRMRIVLDHNRPAHLSAHSFANAVTLCPNLYELNLSLYGRGAPGKDIVGSPNSQRMQRPAPSFDDHTLAILRAGPRIAAFHFNNWSDNSSTLVQLLDIWPSLRSLVVSGTPPQLPVTSSEPFPCALQELRTNFQTAPSIDFMKWLLHNSTSTLRILELEREPSPEMLDHLVSEHGATLESLSVPACASHENAASIRRCGALRELKIENPWTTPALYKGVPRALQHLALGVDKDTPMQPVLQTIKRSNTLEVVTLHMWDGGERHPSLAAIKIACAVRGVELRMTHDIRAFRKVTRGDPVPASSFPRTKCLENIQFMQSRSASS